MTTHARRPRPWPETALDPHEQSELAVKLRYGLGLEQLVTAAQAQEARERAPRGSHERAQQLQPSEQEPRPDARARAASLGLAAGARGRWLSR